MSAEELFLWVMHPVKLQKLCTLSSKSSTEADKTQVENGEELSELTKF